MDGDDHPSERSSPVERDPSSSWVFTDRCKLAWGADGASAAQQQVNWVTFDPQVPHDAAGALKVASAISQGSI